MSDIKISALPTATNITGNELTPLVHNGVTSQATIASIFASQSPSNLSALGSSGYQQLPSGLIMQWGINTSVTGYLDTFTFPIAFKQQCFFVIADERNSGGWSGTGASASSVANPTIYGASGVGSSLTQFQISAVRITNGVGAYQGGLAFSWFSIGV